MATRKSAKPSNPPPGPAAKGKPRAKKATIEQPGLHDNALLTPQQTLFVSEYLKDFNGLQAAIRAGYSPKTAGSQASRMLKHVKVQQAIAPKREQAVQQRAEQINSLELTAERTRLEIARLAYFDPRKLFDKEGHPLAITALDDDTAAAIAGIEVVTQGNAEMGFGEVRKVRIADKNAALEKAAKIVGLYEKDNQQKAQGLAEALQGFVAGIHTAGVGRVGFSAPRGKGA